MCTQAWKPQFLNTLSPRVMDVREIPSSVQCLLCGCSVPGSVLALEHQETRLGTTLEQLPSCRDLGKVLEGLPLLARWGYLFCGCCERHDFGQQQSGRQETRFAS